MKAIVANLGFILQTSGVVTLLALIPAFMYNEQTPLISFFITSTVFLVSGFAMNSLSQRKELDFKSSCILISIVFFLLGVVGAIPYLYSGIFSDSNIVSKIINSLFESVSGYTTTGFSMIIDASSLPKSIIFYRSLTQWIGGIGIVFIILVFFDSSKSLEQLGKAIGFTRMTSAIKNTYVRIFGIYSVYTLIFFGILYALGLRDWINNISLVFSSISTGGFSPVNDLSDIVVFPSNYIIALLMIIGGTSFTVHYRLFTGKFKKALNAELVIYLLFILFFTGIFWLITRTDLATSFFHVASASSTAGSSFIDIGNLAANAKMLLFILMFIGGTTSSTAGGVKIMSVLIFFKTIPWVIKGVMAGSLSRFIFRGKGLYFLDIATYLILILLTISLIIVFAFIFTSFGYTMVDSVFTLTSALSNTGLSAGITNPSLPLALKLILILVMIVGRIGIIAFCVALMSRRNEKKLIAEPAKQAAT
jgi:trk system potassium uptake protein